MSATLESVMAEALKLTPDERAELIETLIASAEPATRLHSEWEAEIGRRLDDLEAGRAEAVPADEVFARIEAKLKQSGVLAEALSRGQPTLRSSVTPDGRASAFTATV